MTDAERTVYEANPLPLAYYQYVDGKIVPLLVSDGFCELKGVSRETLMGSLDNNIYEEVHPNDIGVLQGVAEAFLKRLSSYDVVYHMRHSNTSEYHLVHAVGKWQTLADGTRAVVVVYSDLAESVSDVSKYYADYEKLQHDLYYTDPVTELPNMNYMRQFADKRVNKLRAAGQTPTLIYFDVRSMRSYNNEYGYVRGDRLLKQIVSNIQQTFPEALIARGTDDHFIVIDEVTPDLQEKIEKINYRIKTGAYGRTDGIRAFIAEIEPNIKMVDALDRARHMMKEAGDDLNVIVTFFTQQSNDDYWMRRFIIQSFDMALEQNYIKVYYQSIVRAKTQKITILEALARWVDPNRGVISPNEFIPVLSRYHLLYKLDLYMVEQICKEFHKRAEIGLPLVPVSVNFSAQDFDYIDVAQELAQMLNRYRLDRKSIIVEITEQDIAQGTEQFREQLSKLHEYGFRLWIDDFGSGYSSLKMLGQYHVDRIKFDMEMISHLDENSGANRIIMKSIVEMCRKIGVHTLAEGVETEEQAQFLRDIDCEMVQGFYFYKPEPLEVSAFKVQNNLPIHDCETKEERRAMCDAWLQKVSE